MGAVQASGRRPEDARGPVGGLAVTEDRRVLKRSELSLKVLKQGDSNRIFSGKEPPLHGGRARLPAAANELG